MFGLGLSEIAVIVLLIVVLINPKDLPKIARKIGEWVRKFQDVRSKIDEEVRGVEKEFRRPFDETNTSINDGVKKTMEAVTINQPLPNLKNIMPSRSTIPIRKEDPEEEKKTEPEIIETKILSGGNNDRSN